MRIYKPFPLGDTGITEFVTRRLTVNLVRSRLRGLNPLKEVEYYVRLAKDKESITWKYISQTKGRGVFAKDPITKGSFIVEYRGVLSKITHSFEPTTEYTYIFKHNGNEYCIDASAEDGSHGRLLNDDTKPNSKMKKIVLDGVPHLCLFAITDINEGQEITYDYGGDDLPWRSKRSIKKLLTVTTDQSQLVSTLVPSTECLHQPLTFTTDQSQLVSTHVPFTEVCQYICLLNLVLSSSALNFHYRSESACVYSRTFYRVSSSALNFDYRSESACVYSRTFYRGSSSALNFDYRSESACV
ncbi:uncharacterized protein [Paramisgurnus dabryanus]|uniref:uncharacterized protein n=1 Tax=Paramisgurnus dabryanus TaxID=90735 RepID=UPI0031F35E13